ncbi:MAG: hypothetical protein FWG83_05725 [Oscillospiraceae bacterium]|nr:hypothetical protein [Oscillospiraceae bacterium]
MRTYRNFDCCLNPAAGMNIAVRLTFGKRAAMAATKSLSAAIGGRAFAFGFAKCKQDL